MINLPGYRITEKISDSINTEIYRGQRIADNTAVIIKLLKEKDYPSLDKVTNLQNEYESLHALKQLQAVARFQNEYEILQSLKHEGTVTVYGMEKYNKTLLMILEDGGQDLAQYLQAKPKLPLTEALVIAISSAESLEKIHKQHIIHKNINPAHILLDPATNKVKIIDFDIATRLVKESLEVFSLYQLEGASAYLSPEQTGRMNRAIDYRSDYYSLGVTLYQMVTGVLPFKGEDPLELAHSHIAKLPIPPHQIDSNIPKSISNIIMKLLAKTAEERYQSLFGLITDLKHCLLHLQKTGTVEDFSLGEKDLSGRFQIPEKLYGRKLEIAFLLDTFARVSQGRAELMLVVGHSGIGKSSLVHEVHKPIVEKRGYFISGKFDQLKRNIPYVPFVQALDGLIQQLLTESAANIQQWKTRILTALGPNGAVMTQVLPSLVNIIGEQPPLPELGPTETQNRFILVFQNFIQALATQTHPLVMFLDDLQWVDLPSLKLLRALLSQPSIQYLLLIGAYRDNEVDPTHPLMLTLDSFKKSGITVQTLSLAPLQIPHIQQLLADTMSQELSVLLPLAAVCHAKTLGNPFFLSQFLRAIGEEGLIAFDTQREFWHWQIDKIKARTGTDNVVDLVVSNIQKLSIEASSILKDAACLGNRFDLQMLSVLYEKSPKETAQVLDEVMQESFIMPLDESYKLIGDNPKANAFYQFLHDRVQQAAYSLLSEQEKQAKHLKIGRHLIQNTPADKLEEKLFDILNQLNLGVALITKATEKQELANLNLRAGRKATASAAYAVALNYFHFGLGLLPADAWQTNYNLALQLYSDAAEAAYLIDNFSESERLGKEVSRHARSVLDQVKVYQTKIFTEIARNAPATAVEISLKVLRKLGVRLPKNPAKFHIIIDLLKTKWLLLGKSKEQLVNLPAMQDPYKLAACNVLLATIAPAYYAVPAMYPLVTLALLNLSIRYGYNKGTPAAFASYGIILCGVLGEFERGYEFGQLALQLIEKHRAVESEAKVSLMVNAFIAHWRDPFRQSLAPLLVAHVRGIETGDLDYSAYAAILYIECAFNCGIELPQVAEDTKKFYQICKNIHTHKPVLLSIATIGQAIENLRGLSATDPCYFMGTYYHEDTTLQEAININHEFGLFLFYNFKLMLNYLFRHYEDAYQAALVVPKYIHSATAAASVRIFNFYDSLNRLALCEKATPAQKRKFLKSVITNQKQMKQWAKYAPANNAHKYLLVEAELARIHGQHDKAPSLYDQAIESAKQNEYLQEQALALELAAQYYFLQNNQALAKRYITEAYRAYALWGAVSKLRQLEAVFPSFLIGKIGQKQ